MTSKKLNFVFIGIVLANLLPFFAMIPEAWALAGIYSIPASFAEHIFHWAHGILVNVDRFSGMETPTARGFIVTIPFWSMFGGCFGLATYHLQRKEMRDSLSVGASIGRVGILMLCVVLLAILWP